MGQNKRKPHTVTRSISWRFDTLAAVDARAEELRSDRSSFVNGAMEHMLGIQAHPELVGRTMPFLADRERTWHDAAEALSRVSRKRGKTAPAPGGLVRRPGPR